MQRDDFGCVDRLLASGERAHGELNLLRTKETSFVKIANLINERSANGVAGAVEVSDCLSLRAMFVLGVSGQTMNDAEG